MADNPEFLKKLWPASEGMPFTDKLSTELFETSKRNEGRHIKNILVDRALNEASVVKDYFTTAEGCCAATLDTFLTFDDRSVQKKAGKFKKQIADSWAVEQHGECWSQQRRIESASKPL